MPQAGWYDDPEDATQLRYWDGLQWTAQRRPSDVPPPPPPRTPPVPEAPAAPAGPAATTSPWGTTPSSWEAPGTASPRWEEPAPAADAAGPWPAPPRTFWEAIKICLTKYVDGKGRASRSEYWYFALFTFLVGLVTGGVGDLLLFLPSITVWVRRLHDIGKSAWAVLWILLPVIGWIVLIVYSVRPGEPQPNVYG
jgi:uncharacterized membrane protein YhaH (DUF805 family)